MSGCMFSIDSPEVEQSISFLYCNQTYNLIYIIYNIYIPASHKISVKLILYLWITGHHQNVTSAFCFFSPHWKTALRSDPV